MKDVVTDANFPRTADGRVYHLGVKPGEIANRIITVGPATRARSIAGLLSSHPPPFVLESERGFLTITGLYEDTPITIIAIGMGAPNMDFFVREARECVRGDMVIVRLGSCGGILETLPVGSIVVPRTSVAITRNYDYDFTARHHPEPELGPYRVSKPAQADARLHDAILQSLTASPPARFAGKVYGDVVNASADSFYSSQGRQTSFPDRNAGLIAHLMDTVDSLASLEMETFHLFHLAASWNCDRTAPSDSLDVSARTAPASALPVMVAEEDRVPVSAAAVAEESGTGAIRAASAQMIFAARMSREFITPEHVLEIETWCGIAILDALVKFDIDSERLHDVEGSVWEVKRG